MKTKLIQINYECCTNAWFTSPGVRSVISVFGMRQRKTIVHSDNYRLLSCCCFVVEKVAIKKSKYSTAEIIWHFIATSHVNFFVQVSLKIFWKTPCLDQNLLPSLTRNRSYDINKKNWWQQRKLLFNFLDLYTYYLLDPSYLLSYHSQVPIFYRL